jgi:hypothetical protein
MVRQVAKSIDQIEAELADKKTDKRTEPKVPEVQRESDGLYYVMFNAGGELPEELKGRYTSIRLAEAAVANYLVRRAAA